LEFPIILKSNNINKSFHKIFENTLKILKLRFNVNGDFIKNKENYDKYQPIIEVLKKHTY